MTQRIKHPTDRLFPALLLGAVFFANSAHASTLYRCIDAAGVTLYTNQKATHNNCKVLSVQAVPAPKQGAIGGNTGSNDPRSGSAARNPSPTDFPKVAVSEQKARDTDRRSILENELSNEHSQLEAARKQLAEASKTTATPPQALKNTVALHERNIEALTKEMAKVR